MSDNLLANQIQRANRVKLALALLFALLLVSLFIFRPWWMSRLGQSPPASEVLTVPLLVRPACGAPLTEGDFALAGEAAPDSAVTVGEDEVAAATTQATADGVWAATVRLDKPGPHTLELQATVGEFSQRSSAYPLMIAPLPPTLNVPEAGLELGEGALTVAGVGTPGSKVMVLVDGQRFGSAEIAADGQWTLARRLKPGVHDLQMQIVADDGSLSAAQTVLNVPVSAEYIPPTIEAPAPSVVLVSRLVAGGRGLPGAAIEILVDDTAIGRTQVTDDGAWNFTSETLPPGTHQLVIHGFDLLGKLRTTTLAIPFTLELPFAPTTLRADPTALTAGQWLSLSGSAQPSATLEILVDAGVVATTTVATDGQWVYTPLTFNTPGLYSVGAQTRTPGGQLNASPVLTVTVTSPPIVTPPTLTLPQGSATYVAGEQRLRGSADPSLPLVLVINDYLVLPVTVEASGIWSGLVTFDPGTYNVVAVTQDNTGVVLARSTTLFLDIAPATRPTSCGSAPIYGLDRGNSYIVAPCESLSVIAQRTGLTYGAILAANPQLNNNPDDIAPGQLLNLPPRP